MSTPGSSLSFRSGRLGDRWGVPQNRKSPIERRNKGYLDPVLTYGRPSPYDPITRTTHSVEGETGDVVSSYGRVRVSGGPRVVPTFTTPVALLS